MTTTQPAPVNDAILATNARPLVRFSVTDASLAEMRSRFSGLDAHTDFAATQKAHGECRRLSGALDEEKDTQNRDAIAWQKAVNGEYKRVKGILEEIKAPLAASIKAVNDEARAERERQQQTKWAAEREAAEAASRRAREAEEERLRKERIRLEAEQRAQAEERDRLKKIADEAEAERRALAAAKAAIAAEEDARQRAIAKAASDKLREEQRLRDDARLEMQKAAAEEAERKRMAELRPDAEKIRAFAASVEELGMHLPAVSSREAQEFVQHAADVLAGLAVECEEFGK